MLYYIYNIDNVFWVKGFCILRHLPNTIGSALRRDEPCNDYICK